VKSPQSLLEKGSRVQVKKKILVVDDDEMLLDVTKELLVVSMAIYAKVILQTYVIRSIGFSACRVVNFDQPSCKKGGYNRCNNRRNI